MWAYNLMLKCALYGRVPVSRVIWQNPLFFRRAFSTAPKQTLLVPAGKSWAVTSVLSHSVQRNFHSGKCLQIESKESLAKDVLLFKFDNQRLFKIITLFGCANFCMFMSISLNIYSILTRDPTVPENPKTSEFDSHISDSSVTSGSSVKEVSTQSATRLQERWKWSIFSLLPIGGGSDAESVSDTVLKGLCGATFVLGYILLTGMWLYCNHVVRFIILRKSGKQVTVITHGVFGNNRVRTWNLDEVKVRGSRAISSAVLLNVKGKFFSYILDKRGSYTNPQLFDATVGYPRNWK